MEQEGDEDKSKVTRAIPSNIPPYPFPTSPKDVHEYLEQTEHRYIKWQRVLTSFKVKQILEKKLKRKLLPKV